MLAVDHFDFQLFLQGKIKQCDRLFNELGLNILRNACIFQVEETNIYDRFLERGQECGKCFWGPCLCIVKDGDRLECGILDANGGALRCL